MRKKGAADSCFHGGSEGCRTRTPAGPIPPPVGLAAGGVPSHGRPDLPQDGRRLKCAVLRPWKNLCIQTGFSVLYCNTSCAGRTAPPLILYFTAERAFPGQNRGRSTHDGGNLREIPRNLTEPNLRRRNGAGRTTVVLISCALLGAAAARFCVHHLAKRRLLDI